MISPLFFVAEIDAAKEGVATVTDDEPPTARPHGTLARFAEPIEQTATLLVSDAGYRSRSTDAGGIQVYPPLLQQGFSIDRRVNLDPSASSVGASWGTIEVSNPDGQFDSIVRSWNSDGRGFRVLWGRKTYDPSRGIFLDPSRADLTAAYSGVATPWSLSDTTLSIPLRDASYWIERPYQTAQYLGTGGYEGTTALAGTSKPRTRGGTSAMPVCNVTPLLIDPVNRIYQYTDGPGTVVNLYEGGVLTITRSGDTTDLYSGLTPAGQYRTDNSRGLFQIGSAPQQAITADVTGAFPVAGAVTTAAAIARYMLTEDMLLPTAYLDTTGFANVDAAFPYTAGAYFDPSSGLDGAAAVNIVLTGFFALLFPTRSGTLSLFMLRALTTAAIPTFALTPATVVSVSHVALPSTLDPPPFRWRVGYQHNYTVQTAGILASATADHRQFISIADRYSSVASDTVLGNYRRPNDPAPVVGALLSAIDAHVVATDLQTLWTSGCNLYNVVVPAEVGIELEIGDIVSLTYPSGLLRSGALGQIVGEQFRSSDATITLQILTVVNQVASMDDPLGFFILDVDALS